MGWEPAYLCVVAADRSVRSGTDRSARTIPTRKLSMTIIKPMLAAAAVLAVSLSWSATARADANYAYCSVYSSSTRCDFQTYEQCQAMVMGIGADCIANP